MNVCLYAVATGRYAKMAESLVMSLRDNDVQYDFLAYSDSEVSGATETIPVDPMAPPMAYFQKISLLRHACKLGYDYLVCIDCDILCLKHFSLDRFLDLPCFAILEDNLENPQSNGPPKKWSLRSEWHGVPLVRLVELMLSKNPDMSRPIHSLNAGFFGVRADMCEEFVGWHEKVTEFKDSEEPGLVLAVHSMTDATQRMSIKANSDLILPVIGDAPEVFRSGQIEYLSRFTSWATHDSPALAHFCFFGKQFVMNYPAIRSRGKGRRKSQ